MADLLEQSVRVAAAQGFPPHYRLHKSHEFDAVFKGNKYRLSGPEFLVLAVENQVKHCRLGMVIGKKNAGAAVQRNRIKRLIREFFRTQGPQANESPCLDIVIVARSGVSTRDNQHLTDVLAKGWKKLFKKASVST